MGEIPPRESAAFVWRMEAVLDLYEEPYDEKRPVVVCFELERPCQLLADVDVSRCRRIPGDPGAARGWSTTSTAGAAPATSTSLSNP